MSTDRPEAEAEVCTLSESGGQIDLGDLLRVDRIERDPTTTTTEHGATDPSTQWYAPIHPQLRLPGFASIYGGQLMGQALSAAYDALAPAEAQCSVQTVYA